MDYVREYIDKIKSGEILVPKPVKKWYLNHIEPIINDEHPKYWYHEKRGEKFIIFTEEFCKMPRGGKKWRGKYLKLMLFQKAKYQAIFGILERETNMRRFTESFDVRGRKNGKSTENAALGNWVTLAVPGGETYVAATVASQARRVWEDSRYMIQSDPDLDEMFESVVFPSPTITVPEIGSIYKILSKNVKTFDGLNVSAAVIDEVHELARQIYDILKQATAVHEEPLISMITTAGFVRLGLFDDLYEYSKKVIDGSMEDTDENLFPLIYELDDPSEIENEDMWVKANPGIDVIKSRKSLRYNVARMKVDKNFANTVKVKDFNIVGVENISWLEVEDFIVTEWDGIDPETQEKINERPIVYTEEQLKQYDNSVVLGGFDLSRTQDITAFTTLVFDKEKHRPIAITMYWITAAFFKAQTEGPTPSKVPWRAWVDRGLMRISGNELIDYHDVANYVISNFTVHGWMYQHINYDRYSAQYLIEELSALGYSQSHCLIPTAQGAQTLSIPLQTLEGHLKQNILCYQDNPVTKWMLSNVELQEDRNGNLMPVKASKKRERKIDGVATILNCYVSMTKHIDYYLSH